MGGEPLMNPDIATWLQGLRSLLPVAQLRFVTNGLLLEKHLDIIDLLNDLGNTVLKISCHVEDARMQDAIEYVMHRYAWEPIREFGIDRWKIRDGHMRFQITRPTQFLKTFRNGYADMAPHHSDPAKAFAICVQYHCPMLHNGRLFKCGTAGLTPGVLARHGNPNIDSWRHYLVDGLDSNCSDLELERFVNNFGRPHVICGQCPTVQDAQSLIDHRSTVTFK
jgi:hypothetical protein